MAVLVCENLSLGYGGKAVAEGLSFSLNAGDYMCVTGRNGSGKSTLIKTILGLIPPLSGSVRVCGGVGYLPQQKVSHDDFPASVWEVVMSGFRPRVLPFRSRREKELAKSFMNDVNVPDCRRCFRELSGGQKQRVLLARALCAAENMLVLDEPSAGLDAEASSDMYRVIDGLNRKGMAVMMVTHDGDTALKHANRILHFGTGGISQEFVNHD